VRERQRRRSGLVGAFLDAVAQLAGRRQERVERFRPAQQVSQLALVLRLTGYLPLPGGLPLVKLVPPI
jgi:hypothetical protein